MIKPNPGTSLLFMAEPNDPIQPDRSQPLAALIVYALNERLVHLVVFDQQGNAVPKLNVQLLQEQDVAPTTGVCYAGWSSEAPSHPAAAMTARATAVHLIGAVRGNVDEHIAALHKLTQYIETGALPPTSAATA